MSLENPNQLKEQLKSVEHETQVRNAVNNAVSELSQLCFKLGIKGDEAYTMIQDMVSQNIQHKKQFEESRN